MDIVCSERRLFIALPILQGVIAGRERFHVCALRFKYVSITKLEVASTVVVSHVLSVKRVLHTVNSFSVSTIQHLYVL